MSTVFLPRSAWTNHGAALPMKPLSKTPLRGFAVHWPGSGDQHIDPTEEHSIAARIEGYRQFHVNGRGWSDIAYQYAIDLAGRAWECRGIQWQSAANGNQAVNASHGAVLLMLGSHDVPSPQMIQAVRDFRRKVWLTRYPKATRIVRHGDLYQTDCPGPAATRLVKEGTFLASPPAPHPNPVPKPRPKPTARKPLVTDYVYGKGTDAFMATTLAASHSNLSQIFGPEQAQMATAQGNRVLVLGGPAVASLALGNQAPQGATTQVGNYTVAFGANTEETIARAVAAAKALQVG